MSDISELRETPETDACIEERPKHQQGCAEEHNSVCDCGADGDYIVQLEALNMQLAEALRPFAALLQPMNLALHCGHA